MGQRPNILVFMTDQQWGGTIADGAPVQMPRVQELRRQGLTFANARCPSPHCCPSRASFFTGCYPSQHGVWNNVNVGNALARDLKPGVSCWSERLAAAGYDCAFAGKWHVSNERRPRDVGWREITEVQGFLPELDAPFHEPHEWQRYRDLRPTAGPRGPGEIRRPGYPPYTHYGVDENPFGDADVVAAAKAELAGLVAGEDPWCLYVGTLGPHDPYLVPQAFLDRYANEDCELPASFGDRLLDKPALYRRTRDRFDQLDRDEQREALRHYRAFCSYQDHLFGQLLDVLDASGARDDTLVLFCSDHGDYAGAHGLWCKGLPCFREAYEIPFVCRWPAGITDPGRSVPAPVSLADWGPTLDALTGTEAPHPQAGASLLPWFNDQPPADWRRAHHTQSNGNELYGIQRSVDDGRFKYVFNGFDYDELYDLAEDPHEMHNLLAAEPEAHEATVRRLARELWRFAHAHDDRCINPYIMVGLAPYGPGLAFDGPTPSQP